VSVKKPIRLSTTVPMIGWTLPLLQSNTEGC
jgi:hypothetical protein